jgi:hypothetical protein
MGRLLPPTTMVDLSDLGRNWRGGWIACFFVSLVLIGLKAVPLFRQVAGDTLAGDVEPGGTVGFRWRLSR